MDDRIFGHIVQIHTGNDAQYLTLHHLTGEYEWTGNHEDAHRVTHKHGGELALHYGGRVVPLISEEMMLDMQEENKQLNATIEHLNLKLQENRNVAFRIQAWIERMVEDPPVYKNLQVPKSG